MLTYVILKYTWSRFFIAVLQPEICVVECMQALNMMRVASLVSLLLLQCAFYSVSAVSTFDTLQHPAIFCRM